MFESPAIQNKIRDLMTDMGDGFTSGQLTIDLAMKPQVVMSNLRAMEKAGEVFLLDGRYYLEKPQVVVDEPEPEAVFWAKVDSLMKTISPNPEPKEETPVPDMTPWVELPNATLDRFIETVVMSPQQSEEAMPRSMPDPTPWVEPALEEIAATPEPGGEIVVVAPKYRPTSLPASRVKAYLETLKANGEQAYPQSIAEHFGQKTCIIHGALRRIRKSGPYGAGLINETVLYHDITQNIMPKQAHVHVGMEVQKALGEIADKIKVKVPPEAERWIETLAGIELILSDVGVEKEHLTRTDLRAMVRWIKSLH